MTKRLHPAPRPNPTLPTSIDGNTPADQPTRSRVLDARARHYVARRRSPPGRVLQVHRMEAAM